MSSGCRAGTDATGDEEDPGEYAGVEDLLLFDDANQITPMTAAIPSNHLPVDEPPFG